MLNVVMRNWDEEPDSLMEEIGTTCVEESENLRNIDGKQSLKRKIPKYYDKQQQLELMLAAEQLSEFGDHNLGHTYSDEEEKCWTNTKDIDISKDTTCMELLSASILPNIVDFEDNKRARKRIINYH
jgi:hypothetical protein